MTPLRCTALAALVLVPAATVAVAHASSASPAAARVPALTADSTAVRAGETLTLTGRGFPRDARLALLAGAPHTDAQRIGGAQTGQRGTFVAKIRVRPRASAGTFVAVACLDGCRVKASARFRIVAP